MRKLSLVIGLEAYALFLAGVQFLNGVRTDEAKYLLDIPYPHPPLARGMLGFFDGMPFNEGFFRILFATLIVQAVWIVWEMGRSLSILSRISLCVVWLLSGAIMFQGGTVMMAMLTAFEALLFLWLLSLPGERLPQPVTIGFLWLVTLFTALQGVLLAPLILGLFLRRKSTYMQMMLYGVVPIVLLVLYTLGNPFIPASVLLHSGKDSTDTLLTRALGLLWILALAGSGVGSVVGIVGLALKRKWFILASFILIVLYVFVGRYDYYAILFLPFFITGCKHLFRREERLAIPTAIGVILGTAILLFSIPLRTPRSPARDALNAAPNGLILVNGPMGHEWQYEAEKGQIVRRYTQELARETKTLICTQSCDDPGPNWALLPIPGVDVWVRPEMDQTL